jgi:hypothetical protein
MMVVESKECRNKKAWRHPRLILVLGDFLAVLQSSFDPQISSQDSSWSVRHICGTLRAQPQNQINSTSSAIPILFCSVQRGMASGDLPVLLPKPTSINQGTRLGWTPRKYLTPLQPPPVDDMRLNEAELAARSLLDGKQLKKTRPRRTVDFNGGMGRWTLVSPCQNVFI